MIDAYFDDLDERIGFLEELNDMHREDESLMLCCCYIETLGTRHHDQGQSKARNYCEILRAHSDEPLFSQVHVGQLLRVISAKGMFSEKLPQIEGILSEMRTELRNREHIEEALLPHLNEREAVWLDRNLHKGTIAYISYSHVRSELVHDISAGTVTFSETTYRGSPVPDLSFGLLYKALRTIAGKLRHESLKRGRWWWE